MMTRTTLKALWFGGAGVLTTWLAVSPNPGPPAAAQQFSVPSTTTKTESTAEGLNAQAERLRERTAAVGLRASTRNPFQFNSTRTRPADNGTLRAAGTEPMATASPVPVAPPAPVITLAGMAQTAGKRTAIITIAGQLYLVREGDSLAGRYAVVTIDPETVLIRDTDGTEQRLMLR
jgi:hypothetical protein